MGFLYKQDEKRPRTDAIEIIKKALRNEKTRFEERCLYSLIYHNYKDGNLKEVLYYSKKLESLFPESDRLESSKILINNLQTNIKKTSK